MPGRATPGDANAKLCVFATPATHALGGKYFVLKELALAIAPYWSAQAAMPGPGSAYLCSLCVCAWVLGFAARTQRLIVCMRAAPEKRDVPMSSSTPIIIIIRIITITK